MFTLRPYQVEAHNSILSSWGVAPYWNGESQTFRKVIGNLCTASGKTIIAARLVKTITDIIPGSRCLFCADTDELTDQALKKFYHAAGIIAALEKAQNHASLNSRVAVASAQTLGRDNRLRRFPETHFTHIISDETHRGTDRLARIHDYFSEAKVCGITATAFRRNLKDLSKWFDAVAYELGTYDLIDEGYLPPIKVLTLPVNVDITNIRQAMTAEGKDFNADDVDERMTPHYEEIVRLVIEHASDRHIIAFLPLIRSSKRFVEICRANDVEAEHVDGDSSDRTAILDAFARGDIQLLSNASLLSTGWDCPIADCLLNLKPTRSPGLFRQMAGRIVRVLDGVIDGLETADERKAAIAASAKPNALVLDMLWQVEELGLVGPASLIAADEEEAEAIQKKLREWRTPQELEEVSKQVQLDREERLRRELERVNAKKKRLADAAEVALLFHSARLLHYEPVSMWEGFAVIPDQAATLEKFGVDPATVADRGHAAAILDVCKKRIPMGLCSFKQARWMAKFGVNDPDKKSFAEASGILDKIFN